MTAPELVEDLRRRGVQLWAEGGELRYRAPRGSLSTEDRETLRSHKAEVVALLDPDGAAERMSAGRGPRATPTGSPSGESFPHVVPEPDALHEPFPLTDLQHAYWVGRSGGFPLGNVACYAYFEMEFEELDLERFEEAVNRTIGRHPMLRAVFTEDGEQRILERVPRYTIEVQDCRGAGEARAEEEVRRVRERMAQQVLPTDKWPLFEFAATRWTERRYRLHVGIDLLIADVLSVEQVRRDVFRFYAEPEIELPPLELSFRDFVLAERRFRATDAYRRAETYWMRRLDSLPDPPELPVAQDPATLDAVRFTRRSGGLPRETWQRLQQRGANAGLTASGILLAAFSEVLATWSRRQRFLLNIPLFNRPPVHPEIDEVVGDFTSLNLLEVDRSASKHFADHARRLQGQLMEDLEHAAMSGVRVLRERNLRRGGGPAGLPSVVFTNQISPHGRSVSESTEEDAIPYGLSQTPQVALDHQVAESGGALRFNWDCVEDLFPAGVLDAMFGAYCSLLERLAASDKVWEGERIDLIPEEQRARWRRANATETPRAEHLLHELVEERAAESPSRPAVIGPEGTVEYGVLLRTSRQLAWALREAGARPDRPVAVFLDKRWEQVAAVLGILQSGACYLPIDALLPEARILELLRDAEVELVVTGNAEERRIQWPRGTRRFSVDRASDLDAGVDEALGRTATPDNLAYLIYTSGSTGRPKGVMIEHAAAANTILDVNRRFGVGSQDRVLALSSLGFDLSVYDLFGTLAAGGAIVLPPSAARRDPDQWWKWLREQGGTVWNSAPALMEMLAERVEDRGENAERLRLVLLSGDWIPVTLPDRIRDLAPHAEIVGLGGATEASIWSIFHPIRSVAPTASSIPYGRPLGNQTFHVLNEALEPCPEWTPGDLFIGGRGLARGYWKDVRSTEHAFLHHPRTGERLYRTGDLGRRLPNGEIEFRGREDSQVKIRGHRIELGEIEAALARHPSVHEACVTTVGESGSRKHLVAYVVPDSRGLAKEETPEERERNAMGVRDPRDAAASGADRSHRASGPRRGSDPISDPLERLEFKMARPALRRDRDARWLELETPRLDSAFLEKHEWRRTDRRFRADVVPYATLSRFLSCLLQLEQDDRPLPKARYPSAGDLYPVQVYLSAKAGSVEGLEEGTYYYDPVGHRLMELNLGARIRREHHTPNNHRAFDESAFSLFLIGDLSAIEPLYGDAATAFCYLEAGYLSQLLMTEAGRYGLGLCPVGMTHMPDFRELFGLGDHAIQLHSHLVGPVGVRRPPPDRGPVPPRTAATATDGEPVLAEALREHLRERLPESMVPAEILVLDALPLTSNGKIDRRALPKPQPRSCSAYAGPEGEVESQVARSVGEVLGLERVGVEDSFFDLGASSVEIVQIQRRLRRAFERDLSVVTLFRHPSVRAVARALEGVGGSEPTGEAQLEERAQRQRAALAQQRRRRAPSPDGREA